MVPDWYYVRTEVAAASECMLIHIAPVREAILYEERSFTLGDKIQEKGIYSGRPNAELDLAWHNLLENENIRIPPEVMDHYGRKDIGVAIPDGSGYVGTLNMYHELHCIVCRPVVCLIPGLLSLTPIQKRLHQYMYQDYYFKDITPRQKEKNRLHNGKHFPIPSLSYID